MALQQVLAELRSDHGFMQNVAAWRTLPPQPARTAPIPPALHPALREALHERDIAQLYSHQATAVSASLRGESVTVVTPTASGKTLCYNLPVLHSLLADPDARALYLFPTKALAQDQLAELRMWHDLLSTHLPPSDSLFATYDGDTPSAQRANIRRTSRLILTNPDMLHTGILPYHSGWDAFFAGLRYVVIDEMHTYRGVFGSHVANVLRRLRRICEFYGSTPQFICTSATIANPQELAQRLLETPVTLVDDNGAPRGEKHIVLYNPPCYDPERGLRRSAVLETQELAARALLGGVQTILFGRSRLTTEILLTYLRDRMARVPGNYRDAEWDRDRDAMDQLNTSIRGYRGGYLPDERRAIERGLREGAVRAVVATNALELGIDIGQLQAAVLCGYPGSIASTWQQMGRAGRTLDASLAILVATADVLDQYVTQHPEFLFDQSPEHALISPDNLMLLVDQLRCAEFELPFAAGEPFGACEFTEDVLALLVESGEVRRYGERYFWNGESYPSRGVSLRSTGSESVLVQVDAPHEGRVAIIGEVDHARAPMMVHEGAVYLHEGRSYLVERLALEESRADVVQRDVDYYTSAAVETEVQVLAEHERAERVGARTGHGEVLVRSQVVGYRRIKRFTHETLGTVPLDYPPQEWETSAYWFHVLPHTQLDLTRRGQWMDAPNDYGPNWQAQRRRVRARDGYRCTQCGAPEPSERQHDVHHIVPFRTFGYVPGLNEHYREANQLSNLTLLCRACHQRLEGAVRVRGGLDGLAHVLHNLASLHLMCDPQDIGVAVERGDALSLQAETHAPGGESAGEAVDAEESKLPTIFIYERIAAGLGFGARLFDVHMDLLRSGAELIRACPCMHGCPACVGPVLEGAQVQLETKALTLALLDALLGVPPTDPPPVSRPPIDEVDFGFGG